MNKNLTVGEVAKRAGVAVSTLHFYEQEGLIKSWRTAGNQRRYDRSVLRRVAIINIAKRTGIPLKQIRDHLDKLPNGPVSPQQWEVLSAEWHALLNERIHRLEQLRDEMAGCIGCGCLSLKDCPLRNPDDVLSKQGTGAQLLAG